MEALARYLVREERGGRGKFGGSVEREQCGLTTLGVVVEIFCERDAQRVFGRGAFLDWEQFAETEAQSFQRCVEIGEGIFLEIGEAPVQSLTPGQSDADVLQLLHDHGLFFSGSHRDRYSE